MPRKLIYLASFVLALALVSALGGQGSERRWVKEGSQPGHFTIQEMRPGAIIYRKQNGEQVGEMLVEHRPLRWRSIWQR